MVAQLAFENRVQISECGRYVLVFCRDFIEARRKSTEELDIWANAAREFRCKSTRLLYGKGRDDYFCVMPHMSKNRESTGVMSEFESILSRPNMIGSFPPDDATIRALTKIKEEPDKQWFLHRVTPNLEGMTQIAASEACQSLIIGTSVKNAIGRQRSDYMKPDQLAKLTNAMRDQLTIGDRDSMLDIEFELFSPVTKADRRLVRYNYWLVGTLPNGDLLQLGQCLSCVPIPDRVRR